MSTKLCGFFSVQSPDKEGDSFLVSGMSIENCNGTDGLANSDHVKTFEGLVGRTSNVKKIQSVKDCTTPQQTRLYKKINELPAIWGEIELFDDSGHGEATALAKIIKDYKEKNLPLPLYFSVEVEPVSVTTNKVYTLSVLKRVAVTIKPVNAACHCEVLEEPINPQDPPKAMQKSLEEEEDMKKSELDEKLATVLDQLCERAHEISKALEAGYAVGAAGTNVQGAALQRPQPKKALVEESSSSSDTTEPGEETTLITKSDFDLDGALGSGSGSQRKGIGTTSSGKTVMHNADHASHSNFSARDHSNAADIHKEHSNVKGISKEKAAFHSAQATQHKTMAQHQKTAGNTGIGGGSGQYHVFKSEDETTQKTHAPMGKTSSGQTVHYNPEHESHASFSAKDHSDAAKLHNDAASYFRKNADSFGGSKPKSLTANAVSHEKASKFHQTQAKELSQIKKKSFQEVLQDFRSLVSKI